MSKKQKQNQNLITIISGVGALLIGLVGGYFIKESPNKQSTSQNQNNQLAEIQTDCDDTLYKVSKVIDADTITLENGQKVRLIGIDGPEKGECFYDESLKFTKDLLENQYVKIQKDISEVDNYNRLLRYVIIPKSGEDNILVNDYLTDEGQVLSVSSAPDLRYRDLMATSQQQAIRANKGLWNQCQYEPEYAKYREQGAEPPSQNCLIKGNISERGYGKTYLLPGCDNYQTTKVDLRKGEQYFCSEEEAQKAGYRKATNCP